MIFSVLGYHEFVKGRADYETFWAKPFTIMINSYLICEACVVCGPIIQTELFLITSLLIGLQAHNNWSFLEQFKNKEHFFNHKGIDIYVTSDSRDLNDMVQVTDYIEKNVPHDTLFFAFPSDVIYYYLTDHPAPYRLLHFYKGVNIPPEQEFELIKTLEKRGVEYIVMGNVVYFGNIYGVLGQDSGFLMDKYIKKYFHQVAAFGTSPINRWQGTTIFKKNSQETRYFQSSNDLN